jgi:hypothetical protein
MLGSVAGREFVINNDPPERRQNSAVFSPSRQRLGWWIKELGEMDSGLGTTYLPLKYIPLYKPFFKYFVQIMKLIFLGLCVVLLNESYDGLPSLVRVVIPPALMFFAFRCWRREAGVLINQISERFGLIRQ